MGLAICRKIVERHGGTITAKSTPGKGSVFIVALPAVDTGASIPKMKRIRVMLADDHLITRQGITSLLNEHSDMKVVGEAADGEEAVKMARELQPDVILMDISMPKMNGIESTKVIHSEFPHIRIIGLSMHAEAGTTRAMLDGGAVAFLSKSGHSDDLIAAIRGDTGAVSD
jgi:CheY-like chemotaxis protein